MNIVRKIALLIRSGTARVEEYIDERVDILNFENHKIILFVLLIVGIFFFLFMKQFQVTFAVISLSTSLGISAIIISLFFSVDSANYFKFLPQVIKKYLSKVRFRVQFGLFVGLTISFTLYFLNADNQRTTISSFSTLMYIGLFVNSVIETYGILALLIFISLPMAKRIFKPIEKTHDSGKGISIPSKLRSLVSRWINRIVDRNFFRLLFVLTGPLICYFVLGFALIIFSQITGIEMIDEGFEYLATLIILSEVSMSLGGTINNVDTLSELSEGGVSWRRKYYIIPLLMFPIVLFLKNISFFLRLGSTNGTIYFELFKYLFSIITLFFGVTSFIIGDNKLPAYKNVHRKKRTYLFLLLGSFFFLTTLFESPETLKLVQTATDGGELIVMAEVKFFGTLIVSAFGGWLLGGLITGRKSHLSNDGLEGNITWKCQEEECKAYGIDTSIFDLTHTCGNNPCLSCFQATQTNMNGCPQCRNTTDVIIECLVCGKKTDVNITLLQVGLILECEHCHTVFCTSCKQQISEKAEICKLGKKFHNTDVERVYQKLIKILSEKGTRIDVKEVQQLINGSNSNINPQSSFILKQIFKQKENFPELIVKKNYFVRENIEPDK